MLDFPVDFDEIIYIIKICSKHFTKSLLQKKAVRWPKKHLEKCFESTKLRSEELKKLKNIEEDIIAVNEFIPLKEKEQKHLMGDSVPVGLFLSNW